MATVASSTSTPTASASPPSVIRLMVSPSAARSASELSTASGMEIRTIRVERQDPRNIRIISPVSVAAISPSRTTSKTAWDTNTD